MGYGKFSRFCVDRFPRLAIIVQNLNIPGWKAEELIDGLEALSKFLNCLTRAHSIFSYRSLPRCNPEGEALPVASFHPA